MVGGQVQRDLAGAGSRTPSMGAHGEGEQGMAVGVALGVSPAPVSLPVSHSLACPAPHTMYFQTLRLCHAFNAVCLPCSGCELHLLP